MEWRSEISTKIQLLANRVRCSHCNADSSEALFILDDAVRFRRSISVPPHNSRNPPVFRTRKHLKVNRVLQTENAEVLVRICLRCGTSRTTSIPNI
jgi:hypothetical protein